MSQGITTTSRLVKKTDRKAGRVADKTNAAARHAARVANAVKARAALASKRAAKAGGGPEGATRSELLRFLQLVLDDPEFGTGTRMLIDVMLRNARKAGCRD